MTKLAKFSLAGAISLLTAQAFAIAPSQIIGQWYHDGQPTSIRFEHRHFVICNEQNDCADGFSNTHRTLAVPRWNINGVLENGGSVIAWSNGTRWFRNVGHRAKKGFRISIGNNNGYPAQQGYQAQSGYPAQQGYQALPPRYRNINGPWMHAGRPTSIYLAGDGKNFTITNEEGATHSGYIDQNGDMVLPTLRLTGSLNHTGTHLRWSNGTTWIKR